MATYSVRFINNSQNPGSACVYQKSSAPFYGQLFSLAWFARRVYPGSQATFQWAPDYSFVCAETGTLMPGVVFQTSQQVQADPNNANMVTLDQNGGGLQFQGPQPGGQPGTLTARTSNSIQFGTASVGIGMSGSATFATGAQPNMNYAFTANPSYWIAFGDYQQGQVLDADSMYNSAALYFGGGNALTVTLNPDNTFTVQPD